MTGKKLPVSCVEVVIKLKAPPLNLFDGRQCSDRIVMRFQPDPHFDIQIDIKSPGLDDKVETAILKHNYPEGLSVKIKPCKCIRSVLVPPSSVINQCFTDFL